MANNNVNNDKKENTAKGPSDSYTSASLDALNADIAAAERREEERLNRDAEELTEDEAAEVARYDKMGQAKAVMFAKNHPIRSALSNFLKKSGDVLCYVVTIVCGIVLAVNIVRFLAMLFLLKPNLCAPNNWMLLPVLFLAPVLFFGNLKLEFNIFKYKYWPFAILLGTVILSLLRIFYRVMFVFKVPLWLKMPINELTTPRLVWAGVWIWLLIPTAVVSLLVYSMVTRRILTDKDLKWLVNFRASEHFDFRRNKDTYYDMDFIRDLRSGKKLELRENDRWLHMFVLGSTGTGKSSLIGENLVINDLYRRCENEDRLREALEHMVKEHQATLIHPLASEDDFRPDYVKPEEGYEYKYYDILLTYRPAGFTVVCPDSSLCDIIYKVCIDKGIRVNRIDPVPDEITHRRVKHWTGFNPLYISPSITGDARKEEIKTRAISIANIIGGMNSEEGGGKKDEYFLSVNRSLVIAVLVELIATFDCFEKNAGKVPTLRDMQEILGDFSRIRPYHDKLLELDATDHYFRCYTDFVRLDMLPSADIGGQSGQSAKMNNDKNSLWSQGRGLRLLVNEFLGNRYITDVLCAKDTMDVDSALANSEVTLVNFGLQLGQSEATAFCSIFIKTFFGAVYRRPGTEWSRSPHFFLNDECAITANIVGTAYTRAATLFRKYRVSMIMMCQSITSFENESDRNTLIANCNTLISFGRIGVSEMELFTKYAGTHEVTKEQHTVTETALTDENPNLSMGTREMATVEDILEGSEVRYLKFGELVYFRVRDNAALPPVFGKCNFRDKKSARALRPRYKSNFMKYSSPALIPVSQEEMQAVEAKVAELDEDDFSLVQLETAESLNAMRDADIDLDDLLGTDADDDFDFDNQKPVVETSAKKEESADEVYDF